MIITFLLIANNTGFSLGLQTTSAGEYYYFLFNYKYNSETIFLKLIVLMFVL